MAICETQKKTGIINLRSTTSVETRQAGQASGKAGIRNRNRNKNKTGRYTQAPVDQTMDSAIHRINHYPLDKH